jgi:hypothetical protein
MQLPSTPNQPIFLPSKPTPYNNNAITPPPNPTTLPNFNASAPLVGLGLEELLALPVALALPLLLVVLVADVIVEFEKLAETNNSPDGFGVPLLLLGTVIVAVLFVVDNNVVVDSDPEAEEEEDEEPPEIKNWFEYWKSEPPSRVRFTP